MEYFDLVYNECFRLNKELINRYNDIYFISASQKSIVYGNKNDRLTFIYAPSRYDYGKIMILRGIKVCLSHDVKREYSIVQIVSFIQNECKSFEEDYKTLTLEQLLDNYDLFIELSQKYVGWEDKYKEYIKERYPW